MLDYRTFQKGFAGLCELFQRKPDDISEQLVEIYWQALRDLTPDEFRVATGRAVRELTFFPKPAELLNFVGVGVGAGDARRKLNAVNAWEVVHAAMVKYDYTHSVDFGPLTNAVVRNMGGWLWLCARTVTDLTYDRRKFEELHQQLAETHLTAERTEFLTGKFGGQPVLFQIPGEPERRLSLPETEGPGLALVRDLADKKAAG